MSSAGIGESFLDVVRRRLLGLLFIVIVGSLIALSILIYNKAFTDVVDVTLRADHTGNSLVVESDVKERGLIVGTVTSVTSHGDGAIVTLALEPGRIDAIPSNVSAQILPKTLFGEQYVALITPARPARHIRQGDTIPQDRSKGALETEKVLADIYPLLTAVQPAQLNATLTALADALHNRGDKLGRTLVTLDKYLTAIDPHARQLVDDIKKLGQVSLEYNALAPDIFATLQNLQTSAHTLVEKRAALDSLLVNGTDTSTVLRGFLAENEQRIITVTGQTNKIYPLLERYSPEFSCLFTGISNLDDRANQAISNNRIHLSVTINAKNQGAYRPGQEPTLVSGYGPHCFGLPDHITPTNSAGKFQIPDVFRCLDDGAPLTTDPCARSKAGSSPTPSSGPNAALNSAAETALVDTVIAGRLHTTPDRVPAVATLLAAPLLRGQQVVIK